MTASEYASRNEDVREYMDAFQAFIESGGFDRDDWGEDPHGWIDNVMEAFESQLVIEEVAA